MFRFEFRNEMDKVCAQSNMMGHNNDGDKSPSQKRQRLEPVEEQPHPQQQQEQKKIIDVNDHCLEIIFDY